MEPLKQFHSTLTPRKGKRHQAWFIPGAQGPRASTGVISHRAAVKKPNMLNDLLVVLPVRQVRE